MTAQPCAGRRVRHIRDGLVGTVAGIQQLPGHASPTYQVKWDNGSFESRIDPSEITAVRSGREAERVSMSLHGST